MPHRMEQPLVIEDDPFPDLTPIQAAWLLGCTSADLSGLISRGTLRSGCEPGTVEGRTTFRLALALHAATCDDDTHDNDLHRPAPDLKV